MEKVNKKTITVESTVKAPVKKTWSYWTNPKYITHWYYASDDWYAPFAENDLKVNGKFKTKMAAKDGSSGFDFEGVYTKVLKNKTIEYLIPDGRKVKISFSNLGNETKVIESFKAESVNSFDLQKSG
jgi:uncharacterized protein YndB with AHSA1/START domain